MYVSQFELIIVCALAGVGMARVLEAVGDALEILLAKMKK